MPMSLKGAPTTLQCTMEDFKKYLHARVFIYTDDLIITSETPEHLRDINEVLGEIEVIGMKLRASKCEFGRDEITFLEVERCTYNGTHPRCPTTSTSISHRNGKLCERSCCSTLHYIITVGLIKDSIRPNSEKTKAIDQYYPIPKTAPEVRAFLGMCSSFRTFVYNFASVAAPLFALIKKDAKFERIKECQHARDKLKGALTTAPILVVPPRRLPLVIETDSCAKGHYITLLQ
ncbi:hypothetical protein OESDEN_12054 [Oesophagostomum dentatum]|uniref:RNA-directed DNA polymerase n=1 Tax=Oesophagostomum dentatum TaxID=61180 RepID=A0A0B1SYD6_OESDE|nr:hypothetical protein OESDEN_12054 [Oesophagostomum dentatum]